MDPEIMIMVNVSTALISVLCFYLFYVLFKRYRDNLLLPTLFLSLYSLTIAILYVFVFLLRFPSEENSVAMMTPIVPLGVFIAQATAPFFSASFASLTIHPKRGKWLVALFLALTLYCVALIILNPPVFKEAYGGITELVCHESTVSAMWLTLCLSLVAPAFLIYYTIVIRSKEQKVKGIVLSLSFFALSYLIHYQENFGAGALLYIRRILIFIAMFFLYSGFTMPAWFRKILRL
ncbi:MAG: hypothetical protein SVE93_07780 [Candidatus Thermoplasmatota archaeon]|nr:hypothetical protein [Candidatus Thermoplasmatota archaeon]